MERLFLINAGHGGMVDGRYTTAPDKMYDYGRGIVVYEGVLNRVMKDKVIKNLKLLGLPYLDVCPSNLDIPLLQRVKSVNDYAKWYGVHDCLFIDLHSNAGGGTGFEIYTSPGETASDEFATKFIYKFTQTFPEIRTRQDTCDGDPDKESSFYNLVNTICPAILPEFLFFDNPEDYKKLIDPAIQDQYAEMIAEFCLQNK